jgi:hypothetical protein
MSDDSDKQLVLYTGVSYPPIFPSEAEGLSALEWIDRVRAFTNGWTGESRVAFTRGRLDEDLTNVLDKRLLGPLLQEMQRQQREFSWNFTKLSIAIRRIEGMIPFPFPRRFLIA